MPKKSNPRIQRKKGQPAGSKKHSDLYTDENPKGTIKGLKFATVKDAKASVSKINGSGKSHAHKIQAAVAMEQRAKEMGKTSQAGVYRAYINKMKKSTKKRQSESVMDISKEKLTEIILEEYCEVLSEKKDACYHKVKARYDVWPSAYASGALVKCRKVGAANWGNKSKKKESVEEARGTCWVGYKQLGMKKKGDKMVPNCVKEVYYEVNGKGYGYTFEFNGEDLQEAEYQGRKVKLNKIMQGDKKKFKVYVKNDKGNVVKVSFGDTTGLSIKRDDPERRKAFRARHNCDQKKDKTTPGYWSCKFWEKGKSVTDLMKG